MFVYKFRKLNPDGFKQKATDITHARFIIMTLQE